MARRNSPARNRRRLERRWTLKILFDASNWSETLRSRWSERLARLFIPPGHSITDRHEDADLIFDFGSHGDLVNGPAFTLSPCSPARLFPERTLAWNGDDHPAGLAPGFYASLDRSLYSPASHQTFTYPLVFNECVRARDPAEAHRLAGFSGALTSPIRARMCELFKNNPDIRCRITQGLWNRILNGQPNDPEKVSYANDLASCRFILCPRGNGLGTIRFYEALQTGRVPVVLSDRWIAPTGPDWTTCMLHVPERSLADLPRILRDADTRWHDMARAAQETWNNHYADDSLLPSLLAGAALLRSTLPPTSNARRRQTLQIAARRAIAVTKNQIRKIRRLTTATPEKNAKGNSA